MLSCSRGWVSSRRRFISSNTITPTASARDTRYTRHSRATAYCSGQKRTTVTIQDTSSSSGWSRQVIKTLSHRLSFSYTQFSGSCANASKEENFFPLTLTAFFSVCPMGSKQ